MKKIIIAAVSLVVISSCNSSSGLFRKKEKLGCKTNGRNIGAERIAAGDEKAIKAANKAKFKGGKKFR
ncbi:MAG TPA: hypothetical protein DHV17_09485 [Chitinophagaceae bacterium]|nr:hypothetical protein [Chitinophagaceae bacterium]